MTDEEIDKMADDFVNAQEYTEIYPVSRKAELGAFWKRGFIAGAKIAERQVVKNADLFPSIREWCNEGEVDKYINVGDQILIPNLKVPAIEDCGGESFDEIDLKDVIVTVVHVEPCRAVFNFEDILFKHGIDNECSGKPFDETPLGVYLAEHFSAALKEYAGDVKATLLTRDNVFNEESADFMPYFKPIKNRIKVLAFENDAWSWWLKTPCSYSSSANSFCSVGRIGGSDSYYVSYRGGVAPVFEFAAITGAKENVVIWHDLRKNPYDLPPKIGVGSFSKAVLNEEGKESFYNYDGKFWCRKGSWGTALRRNVIAWCEIPKFNEEE